MLGHYLVTFGHRAMDGPVMVTTTTKDTFRATSHQRSAVSWDGAGVARKTVLAPLPDVSGHFVNTQPVGRLQPNVMSFRAD
jgi:hypothetical protein